MRSFQPVVRAILFGLACSLAACGGGEFTALEGVYTIDVWTQNGTACDVEGPSVLEIREPLLYIKTEDFFGEFLNVNPCGSVEECQTEARDDGTIHLGDWSFEDGSDSDGWSHESAFAFNINDVCEATRTLSTMTALGDGVPIESRSFDGTFAPDGAGECADEAAEAATASAPCTSLEVATATFSVDF